jgi:hypothetical protein
VSLAVLIANPEYAWAAEEAADLPRDRRSLAAVRGGFPVRFFGMKFFFRTIVKQQIFH